PAGILLLALAVPLPLIGLAVVSFLVGIGFALGNTLWMTALQRNVPEHALSRISSFDWLGSVALNPIGYALIGPIAAAIGTPETLILAAVINMTVCISVVLVPSVRALGMNAPVGVTVEAPFAASAAGGAMDGLTDDGHRLPGA